MRRLALLIIATLVIGLSAACARDEEGNPQAPPAGTSTKFPESSRNAVISPTNRPESTASSLVDANTFSATQTDEPPDADLIPCGVVLPIVPDHNVQPVSRLLESNIAIGVVPEGARQAARRLLDVPESVGLVAFEIGKEAEGIYHNADVSMPLASLVKIINLIAYAEAVENGDLDPGTWIPIADIERAYLPGSDLGAHRDALSDLERQSLISPDEAATPMEQIPWMMTRHSSNAASDYLHMVIGQEKIEATAEKLQLQSHTAPCPFVGQFLAISNHTRFGDDLRAVEGFVDDPGRYGREAMRLAKLYMNDPEFRQAEGYWRASLPAQRLFAGTLNASASPRDYAQLMARISQNGLSSDYVNILVRRVLEWPMVYPINQQQFSNLGFKNGALPGVLTLTYYGQRLEDGAQIVVALFYRDLPMGTYREWRRNLTHDELARWLLLDENAIPTLRGWLDPAT